MYYKYFVIIWCDNLYLVIIVPFWKLFLIHNFLKKIY